MLQMQQKRGFFMKILENPLFFGISEESLEKMRICFQMEEKSFREKEEIPIEGKVGILLNGSVSLNRLNPDGNLDMLEYMSDGGIFGAFVNLFQQNGEILVLCEKKCRVVLIDAYHITKRCSNACLHHSIIVENLLNLMTDKVQQLSEKVEILSNRSIREKLLCYFRMQTNKCGKQCFTLPFSVSSLANYLCVDRCAMTRELKHMKEEGILEMQGKQIQLL